MTLETTSIADRPPISFHHTSLLLFNSIAELLADLHLHSLLNAPLEAALPACAIGAHVALVEGGSSALGSFKHHDDRASKLEAAHLLSSLECMATENT
jgi:hypothetical protein